ncbi:serine hydrolase domain-containing protein [Arthrobacter sp. E3]|uniref:serine hydrolase domain-containing protein n=1 Tax=Arthrobacter sp. E3 TaxID=517402 RepID=UPI0032B39B50
MFRLNELNSGVLHQPAQFAHGTKFVHTNSNINLLGAVIEKVTGEPFTQVLKEHTLDPLKQTGTSYMVDASKTAAFGQTPSDPVHC